MPIKKWREPKGRVVTISNPRHKYYGKEAVILFSTAKKHFIRLTKELRPKMDRFLVNENSRVCGTRSKWLTFYINQKNVKASTKMTKRHLNDWQGETVGLLNQYKGMTLRQIEKSIK